MAYPMKEVDFHHFLQSKAVEEGKEARKETDQIVIRNFFPGKVNDVDREVKPSLLLEGHGEILETILPMMRPFYYQTLQIGGAVPVTIENFDETILDGMILKKNEDGEHVLLGTWIYTFREIEASMGEAVQDKFYFDSITSCFVLKLSHRH